VRTIIKITDLATKLGAKSAEPIERSAITVAGIYDIPMGLAMAMDHVSYSRRPSMDTPILCNQITKESDAITMSLRIWILASKTYANPAAISSM
jgi:hypothetical protein